MTATFNKIKTGAYLIRAFQLINQGYQFQTVCENDRITVYTYVKGKKTVKVIVKKQNQ
jgi:hypothetical protein